MMNRIQWPTAIVLGVFVIGWVALAWAGKPIPVWMAATGAIVGKVILASMDALVSGSGGGGASVTRLPAPSSSNGPVPPTAARIGLFGVVLACCGCTNGTPNPQTVTDVQIGLNAAICVLTTYSTDMQAGKGEVASVADAALKCGVSVVQATGLLDSHRKAEALEKAAAK